MVVYYLNLLNEIFDAGKGVRMYTKVLVIAAFGVILCACAQHATPKLDDHSSSDSISTPVARIGEICRGLTGATCEDEGVTTFCKLEPGSEGGVCTALSEATCPEIYDPVCGENGIIYSNKCFADVAGIAIAPSGVCEENTDVKSFRAIFGVEGSPQQSCGGKISPSTCTATNYACIKPIGVCDSPDSLGECVDLQGPCTGVEVAVCGCDGNTYFSACDAIQTGVSIHSYGECNAAN